MADNQRGRLVLLVLVAITGASLWRTAVVEHQKHRLADAYEETKQMAQQLSEERGHLDQALSSTRQTVETQSGNISNLQQELGQVQQRLDSTLAEVNTLHTQIAALQEEQGRLRDSNDSLTFQLSAVLAEKQELERKLTSLPELRLAIRHVKHKLQEERWDSWRARIAAFKRADQEQLASGNRGYVVREGVSTLGSSTAGTLQVRVLEPESQ